MDPVLALTDVSLVREGRRLLDAVTWSVQPGERWVVLGRNGSGKSTLLKIASLYLHPSEGTIRSMRMPMNWSDSTPEPARHAPRLGLSLSAQ